MWVLEYLLMSWKVIYISFYAKCLFKFFPHTWPWTHPSLSTSPQFPSEKKIPTCPAPTLGVHQFHFWFLQIVLFPNQREFYTMSQIYVFKDACFRCWVRVGIFQWDVLGVSKYKSSKCKSFTSVCLWVLAHRHVGIDHWPRHVRFEPHYLVCTFIRTASTILSLVRPGCLGYSYVYMHIDAMIIKCLSLTYCVWIQAYYVSAVCTCAYGYVYVGMQLYIQVCEYVHGGQRSTSSVSFDGSPPEFLGAVSLWDCSSLFHQGWGINELWGFSWLCPSPVLELPMWATGTSFK